MALAERLPSAVSNVLTVFAYRKKTPRAAEIAAQLSARLPQSHTRFVENTPDILALVAGAAGLIIRSMICGARSICPSCSSKQWPSAFR